MGNILLFLLFQTIGFLHSCLRLVSSLTDNTNGEAFLYLSSRLRRPSGWLCVPISAGGVSCVDSGLPVAA